MYVPETQHPNAKLMRTVKVVSAFQFHLWLSCGLDYFIFSDGVTHSIKGNFIIWTLSSFSFENMFLQKLCFINFNNLRNEFERQIHTKREKQKRKKDSHLLIKFPNFGQTGARNKELNPRVPPRWYRCNYVHRQAAS